MAGSYAEQCSKAQEALTATAAQHTQQAQLTQQAQHAEQAQHAQRFNAGKHARKREREAQKKAKVQAKGKGSTPPAAEAKDPAVAAPSLQQQATAPLHPPQVCLALQAVLTLPSSVSMLTVITYSGVLCQLFCRSAMSLSEIVPASGSDLLTL